MAWSEAARRAALETRRLRVRGKLMTTGMVRMGAVGRDERYIMQQGMKKAQVRSWISGSGASKGEARRIMGAYARVRKYRKLNIDPYSRR